MILTQSTETNSYTSEEIVARHEAAHFIVMVYLLVDNLPLITKVALSDDNTNGVVSCDQTKQVKEFFYVFLAGHATDPLIKVGYYHSLLTISRPFEDSDLDKYLDLYSKLNDVKLLWDDVKTHEIIINDLQDTVKLCTKLDNDINDFATLLLGKRIIDGELLTHQIEHYSKKYSNLNTTF
jgi:hypothetical protein